MKKISILTLKLGENYGGILQAYALQRLIRNLGYQPETTWIEGSTRKHLLKIIPGVKTMLKLSKKAMGRDVNDSVSENTELFIREHIRTVPFARMLFNVLMRRYTAHLVGSDQVWRNAYAYVPYNMFSFIHRPAYIFSYAASFGKDNLNEYSNNLISVSRRLANRFKSVSVREDSGVSIAEKFWGIKAEQHVDPTLLITAEEYNTLIDEGDHGTAVPDNMIFEYVLDPSAAKSEVLERVEEELNTGSFRIISSDGNSGAPLPSVLHWIKSFRNSDYVVTDSFHGTVFSIIFNKPFLTVGNEARGLSRFRSLLDIFNLSDRLIKENGEFEDSLIRKQIDWISVNSVLDSERSRSLGYLRKNLRAAHLLHF